MAKCIPEVVFFDISESSLLLFFLIVGVASAQSGVIVCPFRDSVPDGRYWI